MTDQYDIVVVGSGHNPLITAAYLAKAGMKTLVLEKADFLGGGVVTKELTVPGFKHDEHSVAHTYIQANPLITQDELGLKSKYGLEYIYPEVALLTVFEDGTHIATYKDIDRTCDSIAEISPRDAEAYRIFARESSEILPMLTSALYVPPTPQGPFWALLDQSTEGRRLMHIFQKSALDLVKERFENEKVIVHLLKFISEGIVGPEEKGTGITLFTMPGFVHNYPPGMPKGGSGMLVQALLDCLADHGAEVRANAEVTKILSEGGKAVGVRLADGEEIKASRGVIAAIHPRLLGNYVDGLSAPLLENASRVIQSGYAPIVANVALSEPPRYNVGPIADKAFITGIVPTKLEEFRRIFDYYRYGEIPPHNSMGSIVHTNHDPSRAPLGKSTLYLWTFAPFSLKDGGPERWDELRESSGDNLLEDFKNYCGNVNESTILGHHYITPLDVQRHSPSFLEGDVHGAGPYLFQFGGHRPTPELSKYAVPGVDGLYLCGCFMHPGGGVFGSGRATAIKIFDDFEMDFDAVSNGA